MNGFPLAPVDAADTATLAEAGVSNGDALQLEKKVGEAAVVATAAAAAASANPSLPPWCYKGAAVTYTRTGAAATVIAVHPPMPGDPSSFVAIRFSDGAERETTIDCIASGDGGGGGGGAGGGNAAESNGSGAAGTSASVATDAERAQLLSLGIDDEQLAALNALPLSEQLEMAGAFGLTRIPSSLLLSPATSTPTTSTSSTTTLPPSASQAVASSLSSAPAAAAAAAAASATGGMQRKTVPADNSCLFTSVGYLLQGHDTGLGPQLRELCCTVIESDPLTYSEVRL